jgi:hypothetical protein
MTQPLHALLGASVALPLVLAAGSAAAQSQGGHYVYVPPGEVAVIVPPVAAAPADFPVARIFAQQEAMMRHMMADMDTLLATPMPDPDQMIRSVMSGMPQVPPGSSLLVTSFSTGNGTCSQTITYDYPANGGQPLVNIRSSGNACGRLNPSAPITVTQPVPSQRPTIPQTHERLWSIGYPPHPIMTDVPSRD